MTTALNFPLTRGDGSPLQSGDQYTGPNGVIYEYDGVKWVGHASNTAGSNSINNGGNVLQVDPSGNVVTPAYTLPNSTGTVNQVLTWPSSGSTLAWSNQQGGSGASATATNVGSFGTDQGIGPFYNINDPAVLFSNDDMLIRTGGTAAAGGGGYGEMDIVAGEQLYIGTIPVTGDTQLIDATTRPTYGAYLQASVDYGSGSQISLTAGINVLTVNSQTGLSYNGSPIGSGSGGPVWQLTSSTAILNLSSSGIVTIPGSIASNNVLTLETPATTGMIFDDSANLTFSPGITVGAGAFTVDLWFNAFTFFGTNTNYYATLLGTVDSGDQYAPTVYFYVDGTPYFYVYGTSWELSSLPATNQLHHLAVARDSSGNENAWIDGVGLGTQTDNDNYTGLIDTIGSYYDSITNEYTWDGIISNVKIEVGSNAYDPTQSTISVPARPLSADPGTQLLLLDTPVDISGNQTVTNNGVTVVTATGTNYWTFDGAGSLTVPGAIQSAGESDLYLTTTLGAKPWKFGTDGNLTVPGIVQSASTSNLYLSTSASSNLNYWINTYGDLTLNSANSQGASLAYDSQGNMIVAGGTYKYIDSNFGTGIIVKYDRLGNVLWDYHQVDADGTPYNSTCEGIAVDTSDNIYVFCTDNEYTVGHYSGLVIKLDPNGNVLWQTEIVGWNGDTWDIAVDSLGNSYITGNQAILVKLDVSGNIVWQYTTSDGVYGYVVHVDNADNIYVGLENGVFEKFDANGNPQWNQTIIDWSNIWSITSDSSNNVFVADENNHIASFTSSGVLRWQITVSNASYTSMDIDGEGNLYLTGSGETNWTGGLVITKISNAGSLIWNRYLAAIESTGQWYDYGHKDIAVHSGVFGITGYTYNSTGTTATVYSTDAMMLAVQLPTNGELAGTTSSYAASTWGAYSYINDPEFTASTSSYSVTSGSFTTTALSFTTATTATYFTETAPDLQAWRTPVSGSPIWQFDTSGNLTMPGSLVFGDGTVQETAAWTGSTRWSVTPAVAGCEIYAELTPDHFWAYTQQSHVTLENNGYWDIGSTYYGTSIGAAGNDWTKLFIIANDSTGTVSIATAGLTNRWTFGDNGSLTFPDTTVQTTAWTGTVAYSNVTGAPTAISTSTLFDNNYTLKLTSNGAVTINNNFVLRTNVGEADANAWFNVYGDNTHATTEWGASSAYDSQGNLYVVGSLAANGAPVVIGILLKYSPNGDLLWQRGLVDIDYGLPLLIGESLVIDSSDNIYVVGSGAFVNTGAFITKISSQGDILSQTSYGYGSDVAVSDIAVDNAGNVYICGVDYSTDNSFVVSLNMSGTINWQQESGNYQIDSWGSTLPQFNGLPSNEGATAIVVDNSYAYVTGQFNSSPSVMYVSKLSLADGSMIWLQEVIETNESGSYWGLGIDVDSQGNVYAIGGSNIDGSASLIKFNANGDLVWNTAIPYPFALDVTVATDGYIYLTGNYYEGPSTPYGLTWSKYDSNGNYILGGLFTSGHEGSGVTWGHRVGGVRNGALAITGYTTESTATTATVTATMITLQVPTDGSFISTPETLYDLNWVYLPLTTSGGPVGPGSANGFTAITTASTTVTSVSYITSATDVYVYDLSTSTGITTLTNSLFMIGFGSNNTFTNNQWVFDGSIGAIDLPNGGQLVDYNMQGGPFANDLVSLNPTNNGSSNLLARGDGYAQLMWITTATNVTGGVINGGANGQDYNWTYVDNAGLHIENHTTNTSKHWQFNVDGSTQFPNFTLTTATGTNGQVLTLDNYGNASWQTPSGGSGIGYTGSAGTTGYVGSAGIGYTGSAGTNGTNGNDGATGYIGSQGIQGIIGYTGSAGSGGGGGYSPAGYGSVGYSGVKIISTVATWTQYTLTGTLIQLFSGQVMTTSTNSQTVYGSQYSSGDKILIINDSPIQSNSYGIVIEFPASPSVGDTFAVPAVSLTTATTISISAMVAGNTYTIVSTGNTNWTGLGVTGTPGQSFYYGGGYNPGGSGTVSYPAPIGVKKLIFKPASGQQAILSSSNGQATNITTIGTSTSYIAAYMDLTSFPGTQPITWLYGGIQNGLPTWYQMYF